MSSDTQSFSCRICSNAAGNIPYTAREMMYGLRDEFQYFECGKCGCLQIAEIPEDMTKYYPSQYYSFSEYDGLKFKGPAGFFKTKVYEQLVFGGAIAKRIMGLFSNQKDYEAFNGLGISRASRILDVGCGNGQSFLYPLAEIGFSNLLGCDPYLEKPISYSNGLKIENTNVFEMKGQWNMITYHHSFEHISDPLENLQKAKELLVDGGVCLIRIPTASSFAWKHYRANWAQLDAPRHFFLHTVESMQELANRSGLELYKVIYDSTHFQFSGSEKYVNDTALAEPRKKGIMKFIRRKLKKREYTRKAKELNQKHQGDQAGFYLRKKSS